ncbi:DUF6572 domain-containing protein [Burkholderia alba]|uniref:DUF6572 domain-containing protein n=1 Tax=Burkholderia alba TaxID=2683677 RepID=UPI002B057762|nr:DUF6572 domain-containing protein [Burkholderia alba]
MSIFFLQEKINKYLRLIEDGALYRYFPNACGCQCEIELHEKYPLPPAALDF